MNKWDEVINQWEVAQQLVNLNNVLNEKQILRYNIIINYWMEKAGIYAQDYDVVYPQSQEEHPENPELKGQYLEELKKIEEELNKIEEERQNIILDLDNMDKILKNTEDILKKLNSSAGGTTPAENPKIDQILDKLNLLPAIGGGSEKFDEIITLIKNLNRPGTGDKTDEIIKLIRGIMTPEQRENINTINTYANVWNGKATAFFTKNEALIKYRTKWPEYNIFYNFNEVDKWIEGIKKDVEEYDKNKKTLSRIILLKNPLTTLWSVLFCYIYSKDNIRFRYNGMNDEGEDIKKWVVEPNFPNKIFDIFETFKPNLNKNNRQPRFSLLWSLEYLETTLISHALRKDDPLIQKSSLEIDWNKENCPWLKAREESFNKL